MTIGLFSGSIDRLTAAGVLVSGAAADDMDIDISPGNDNSYHAENPSIAFGGGKFFVVWEENPSGQPAQRYEIDIKAALVTTSGQVTNRFTICNAQSLQCDPCVAYDSNSNRFFVVWEDARDSTNNYDVYGRIYTASGSPVGADFQVAAGANCQDEPWVCSDNQGNFMVVYENGYDPQTGPFSLEAQRYDPNGNKVGSTIPIASSSSSSRDHIFPSVSYCSQTERYFVAWNDADLATHGFWNLLDNFSRLAVFFQQKEKSVVTAAAKLIAPRFYLLFLFFSLELV